MRNWPLLLLLCTLCACNTKATPSPDTNITVSNIADDEHVVFFRTSAWYESDADVWRIPIHGWIYEPEDSVARKSVFKEALETGFDLDVDETADMILSERLNLLIADNERGKQIVIDLAGRPYTLPQSAPNGHFEAILSLSGPEMAEYASAGRLSYFAITHADEERVFSGEVLLVLPEGLSVISDIDDTVKISEVTDHKRLLSNTFLREFEAAPGMQPLFAGWADQGARFHFVSSSPWQLYTPLASFLEDAEFPPATFSLKNVRFRDETLLNLFKKGTETKPAAIRTILDRYPDREFLLVGDSGEQDPEVYAALMHERPEQIKAVYIRNVTQETREGARFSVVFDGLSPDRWYLFGDPRELRDSPAL